MSPKASATLTRRALQGLLRDFYEVEPGRLFDEINSVKPDMDPDLWEAIDGLRRMGNIGAHMEKDIGVIVDVEPDEAQKLISLLEMLIDETYVAREKRKSRIAAVVQLTADKKEQANMLPPKSETEEP